MMHDASSSVWHNTPVGAAVGAVGAVDAVGAVGAVGVNVGAAVGAAVGAVGVNVGAAVGTAVGGQTAWVPGRRTVKLYPVTNESTNSSWPGTDVVAHPAGGGGDGTGEVQLLMVRTKRPGRMSPSPYDKPSPYVS